MKIIIFASYYYPEQVSSSFMLMSLSQKLAEIGNDVIVYAPIPSRNIIDKRNIRLKEVLFDGKLIIKRFLMIKERKNSFLRALRYLLINFKYFMIGVFTKCDVIFSMSTPPTQGFTLGLIRKLSKHLTVYNVQDIFPESLIASNIAKANSLLVKIGKKIERFTYHNVDVLVTISNEMAESLKNNGALEKKISVINNWVDLDHFLCKNNENPLYFRFLLEKGKFYVVYAGNLGDVQTPDLILDAAKNILNHNNISFLIFGNGKLRNHIEKRIKTERILNVRIFDLLSHDESKFVYDLSDICLVTAKSGIFNFALPSKIMSIFAAGKPVLITTENDTNISKIVRDNNLGFISNPESIESLVEMIMKAYNDKNELIQIGLNSRKYAIEHFSIEYAIKKYMNLFNQHINK